MAKGKHSYQYQVSRRERKNTPFGGISVSEGTILTSTESSKEDKQS